MRRTLFALALLLALSPAARADEGMWPFNQVPLADLNHKYGTALDSAWLAHLQRSTVRLEGSCSGSFVSPDGLVLTNHHCVQDAMDAYSTPQRDLLTHGFMAATREQELACPSIEVEVLVDMVDVTAKVNAALKGLDDTHANEARKRVLSELEMQAEAASRRDSTAAPLLCEAVTLYEGGQYLIYEYKRYSDVRLVFAPEYAISDFGGDPDNFQYPRWCFDLGLLRVYENGKPAHTPDFLNIDWSGPHTGDPVFVSGHPGHTERLLTVDQLKFQRDAVLPRRVTLDSELRGRYLQFGKQDAEYNREVQEPLLGLENGLKVRRVELTSLIDDALIASKARAERELRARVAADPKLKAETGDAWGVVAAAQARARELDLRHDFIESRRGLRGQLYDWARTIVRGTAEREKPNGERLREYAESVLPYTAQRLLGAEPAYPSVERLELTFGLERLREYLGPDDPFVQKVLGHDTVDSLAGRLVAGTRLGDSAFRRELWEGGAAAVRASRDPMIQFALDVDRSARAIRKQWEDEVEAPTTRGAEKIARARFKVYGTKLYPDATSTLRLNDGRVEGWLEQGSPVVPFTTVGQAFTRATGADPLMLPPSWLAVQSQLDPATPFNFCTTNDIVGGNSGSPMVNARGDLVGLVFDGNIESIAGSYWFDPSVNRTVAVHTAAIKAAFTTIYRNDALAHEMGMLK